MFNYLFTIKYKNISGDQQRRWTHPIYFLLFLNFTWNPYNLHNFVTLPEWPQFVDFSFLSGTQNYSTLMNQQKWCYNTISVGSNIFELLQLTGNKLVVVHSIWLLIEKVGICALLSLSHVSLRKVGAGVIWLMKKLFVSHPSGGKWGGIYFIHGQVDLFKGFFSIWLGNVKGKAQTRILWHLCQASDYREKSSKS